MLRNEIRISNKSIRKRNKKRKKNKKVITLYTVAGGDTEGKVTYTYPTGNSEDY